MVRLMVTAMMIYTRSKHTVLFPSIRDVDKVPAEAMIAWIRRWIQKMRRRIHIRLVLVVFLAGR